MKTTFFVLELILMKIAFPIIKLGVGFSLFIIKVIFRVMLNIC